MCVCFKTDILLWKYSIWLLCPKKLKERAVIEVEIVHANLRDDRKSEWKIGIFFFFCMWAHVLVLCMWLSICIRELEKHLTKTPWFIAMHVTPGTAIYWKFWHDNSRMVNVRNLKFFSFLLSKYNSWRMCLCKIGFIISSNILTCYLKGLCAFC